MHKKIKSEAYTALEEKGRCNLKSSHKTRKGKMLANGATKHKSINYQSWM